MKVAVYTGLLLSVGLIQALSVRAEETLSFAQVYAAYETVRPGDWLPVAVKFNMAEGWHTYAKEPGDSGMPPSTTFSGPEGLRVSEWRFPNPESFTDSVGTSYGYDGHVVLLSEVLIPETASDGSVIELTADIKWMICRDICVFQTGTQTISVRVERGSSMETTAEWKRLLQKSRWKNSAE